MHPDHFIDSEIFGESLIFWPAGAVVRKFLLNGNLQITGQNMCEGSRSVVT